MRAESEKKIASSATPLRLHSLNREKERERLVFSWVYDDTRGLHGTSVNLRTSGVELTWCEACSFPSSVMFLIGLFFSNLFILTPLPRDIQCEIVYLGRVSQSVSQSSDNYNESR